MRKHVIGKGLAAAAVLGFLLTAGVGTVGAQAPLQTKDYESFSWRHIGPWTFSGRFTDFAVPPGQSQKYYALNASGGLWVTEDGGISFQPLFEQYGNMSMGALGIAPSNPDILYLGTGEAMHARSSAHGNGVWKSTDGGETWEHIGLEESYFIPKVVVHPTDPDIVYVATEGTLYSNEADSQRGLYKSTDGGRTWTDVFPVDDRGVGDFVMDPTDPDILLAMAYKTFRRTYTFIDRQPENWIYKTTDGGQTWKRLENGLPLDKPMGRGGLAMYPKDPDIVYARLDELVNLGYSTSPGSARLRSGRFFREGWYLDRMKEFEPNSRIMRLVDFEMPEFEEEGELVSKLNQSIMDEDFLDEIDADIGELNQAARRAFSDDEEIQDSIAEVEKFMDWDPETDEEEQAKYQTLNRHVLQLIYAPAMAIQQPVTFDGAVYRSDDKGESWRMMTEYSQERGEGSAQVNDTEAGYYGDILVDPNDPDVVYLCNTRVDKSTDAGKTFQDVPWFGSHATHVDTRGMWIDPLNSDHILNANDGGVSETWDGGEHWSQKETIPAQQFYDISVDAEQPYNVMGGTQDNGAWIGPSRNRNSYGVYPADWRYLPTGDGFYVVRDWWDPRWIYFESQFGSSRRMNLETGEMVGISQRTSREESARGMPDERYQWDAPIVLSPHNPGIVYICSQHVWRSMSRGENGTWERISPDLSRADPERISLMRETNMQYATIYTFAESPVKPGVFWAGTDDGNLQVSTDFGKNWTNITYRFWTEEGQPKRNIQGDRIPFDRWVARVTPSAHDLETCYVAWTGYRTHNEDTTYLFKTEDMGKTWTDLSGGMMNPVNDVVEDPDNPDVLYLATDYGLYVSIDSGEDWTLMSESAPDVIIMDLDIQERERDLAIGTYGRGIYLTDIFPIAQFTTDVFEEDAHFFEPQRAIQWNMFEARGSSYGEFARVENPDNEAFLYYYLKEDVEEDVTLAITDLEGEDLGSIEGEQGAGLHRVAWDMRQQTGNQSRWRRGRMQPPGTYKVTLKIGDEEIATRRVVLEPDPEFK